MKRTLGALALSTLGLSGCYGDGENVLRQTDCFTRDQILPEFIERVEGATKERITRACGGSMLISSEFFIVNEQELPITILETASHTYTMQVNVKKILADQTKRDDNLVIRK